MLWFTKYSFLAHLYESTGICCFHPDVGMGMGIGFTLLGFTFKFFM